jgi:hypothetical protein
MPLADLPQTNKMHAVPQNIMDVEFKLIGDLTLRQFIYLFVFGGAAYLSAVSIVGIFKWPSVIFFAFLGVGLAFVPVEERGLDEWIVNFVKSVYSPTQRIWRRELTVPSAFMYDNLTVVRQELITLAPTSSRRRLEEYLEYKVTDQYEDPLDIPEKEYILKVRNAFGDTSSSSSSVGVGVYEPRITPAYPSSAGLPPEPIYEPPKEEPKHEELSVIQEQPVLTGQTVSQVPSSLPEPRTEPEQQPQQNQQTEIRKTSAKKHHKRHPSIGLSPMTPDMHSGRRFINLVPGTGELVLPIRGERVIRSNDEMEVEADIQDRAEKLTQLLNRIKRESGIPVKEIETPKQILTSNQQPPSQQPTPVQVPNPVPPQISQQPAPPQVDNRPAVMIEDQAINREAQIMAQKLKSEQARISEEISKLETQPIASPKDASEKDAKLQKLKGEQQRTQFDYEALQNQIADLQERFKQKLAAPESMASKNVQFSYGGAPVSDTRPNTITGTVKSKEGNVKENILVIVKNDKNEAVRAVKTNALGQFRLTTPVVNGKYTLEVATPVEGSTFDIISVEAKGDTIPAIEITGK